MELKKVSNEGSKATKKIPTDAPDMPEIDPLQEYIVFKHSANSGDLIYALAGIKSLCDRLGKKALIYQALNVEATYYPGASHPLGNKMMTPAMWNMMKPLLDYQDYIGGAEIHSGKPFHYDLDLIRQYKIGLPNHNIAKWYSFIFPDLWADLSKPWLKVPDVDDPCKDAIVCNFTSRYRNNWIHYGFLHYMYTSTPLIFAGTQKEYGEFIMICPRAIHLESPNFLGLAIGISKSKVFIGNQSMCFAIAEALKVPRLLEVCHYAPNVDPAGQNGYMYYFQKNLQFYLDNAMSQ